MGFDVAIEQSELSELTSKLEREQASLGRLREGYESACRVVAVGGQEHKAMSLLQLINIITARITGLESLIADKEKLSKRGQDPAFRKAQGAYEKQLVNVTEEEREALGRVEAAYAEYRAELGKYSLLQLKHLSLSLNPPR
jgi:hypothetical protein